MSLLKHNEPDSMIRRPPGICDSEWNWLVTETIKQALASEEPTSFLQEMVRLITNGENLNEEVKESILDSLGIKQGSSIQNWEHASFRFFRHFCPENMRNALNHSLMPFARLVVCHDGKHHTEFKWLSEKSFELRNPTELTTSINASVGDELVVVAWGHANVESIRIYIANGESLEYYCKGRSKSFGDMMYALKKTLIANK